MKRYVSATALAVVAAAVAGCGGGRVEEETSHAAPAVQATLAEATLTAVEAPYEAVGTVRAQATSSVQSKATGHVTAVLVREGDRVERGQVLVEIDNRDAEAQLRRAQSAVREAQEARREVDRAVMAAEHARSAADASAELAQSTYRRYKGLMENDAVSRQAYDEANARWRMAAAETARAGEMLGSMQARRGEIDARIQQAEAELAAAQTALTYTKVTAPFDGIVTRKTVDVGDLAAPGNPLLEIETTDRYRLEALVVESVFGRFREGDRVPVVIDAVGAEPLAGVVAQLVPSADAASRTSVVKIDLPPSPAIRSGLFGRARFAMDRKEALTVPASAVVQRGQLTAVYTVAEDRVARMRLVTTGNVYGDRVEILSGLEAGERVVADGLERVTDGSRIGQD